MRELEWIDVGDEVGEKARSRQTVSGRKRRMTSEEKERRKRKRRRVRLIRGLILIAVLLMLLGLCVGAVSLVGYVWEQVTGKEGVPAVANVVEEPVEEIDTRKWKDFYNAALERPELSVQLLTVNDYSRPGEVLPEVKNIFVHYTANKGTTAEQNRSYFESLAETKERSASAHFIIGYDGVIVQCIPTKEIAYAVQTRNYDSISIECCYVDEDGKFTQETYDSLIELTAWLLHKYELEPEDVLRHYDSNGKMCPKYYVENEDAWQQFLMDLAEYMKSVSEQSSVQSVGNGSMQEP